MALEVHEAGKTEGVAQAKALQAKIDAGELGNYQMVYFEDDFSK